MAAAPAVLRPLPRLSLAAAARPPPPALAALGRLRPSHPPPPTPLLAVAHRRPFATTHAAWASSAPPLPSSQPQSPPIASTAPPSSSSSSPPPPPPPRPRTWLYPALGLAAVGLGSTAYLYRSFNTPSPTPTFSLPTPAPSPPKPPPSTFAVVLQPFQTYLLEPLLTALRFLHLVALFLPVLLLSPVAFIGPHERLADGGKGEKKGAVWWYGLLVGAMQRAGPSFIKLAQWAGSRTDLFPPSLCAQFAQLHSNGKPHRLSHTVRVVERAFNRPFADVFESFEPEPMGCGAIAQVYKGVLKPDVVPPSFHAPKPHPPDSLAPPAALTGRHEAVDVPTSAVALKVLHPGVHATVARDLKIMAFFASLLNLFPGMEWISLPEEVGVFGDMMNQQLDLRIESANLSRFEANFAHRRGAAVSFPRPVQDFGTEELLVEEFENGLPLKWFLRNGGGEYDSQLANMGLDAFLKMLLLDNFTHGDLHPGNIMVKFYRPTTGTLLRSAYDYLLHNLSSSSPSSSSPQAAEESDDVVARLLAVKHDQRLWLRALGELFDKGYRPELVFIDAGLVTCLDERNRRNFLDLFQAIAEFDGYRAGKLMVERCRTPELVIEPEHFALKIQHIVLSVQRKTFTLSAIRISDILTQVLQSVQAQHVKMEGDFINTILSILLLEGIGRQLDPQLDLFKSALPILRQVGGRMGTKEAMAGVPANDLGAMLKIWLYLEARQLASNVKVDWDEFIRYDRLTPNV